MAFKKKQKGVPVHYQLWTARPPFVRIWTVEDGVEVEHASVSAARDYVKKKFNKGIRLK
jgi:hypothetical protein